MADVVVSEFMDAAILDEVLGDFDVLYDPSLVDDRNALLSRLSDARAIIVRNRTRVDADLLTHAPKLTVVGRLGVGLDSIDLDACAASDVAVCPATGANDVAVAEYAITAALVLLRGAWFTNERMIAGDWPRTESIGREMSAKRLGLIGLGAIAREVATRAHSLGMQVAACDPYMPAEDTIWDSVVQQSLGELAETSDVVSVHVPLTNETRNLVDEAFISRMPQGSILINTARGGVVDEAAVANALRNGSLGGAALDVFASEPLSAAAAARFADVPGLLITPHIAGITEESNLRVSRVTAENVLQQLRA